MANDPYAGISAPVQAAPTPAPSAAPDPYAAVSAPVAPATNSDPYASVSKPADPYAYQVKNLAADKDFIPESYYANFDPSKFDPSKNPDDYLNATKNQQLAVDVQLERNKNPQPIHILQDVGTAAQGIGQFAKNVAQAPAHVISLATLQSGLVDNPEALQHEQLNAEGATAALKNNIYDPKTGAIAGNLVSTAQKVADNFPGLGTGNDAPGIRLKFEDQAANIRRVQQNYKDASSSMEAKYGQPLTDDAKQELYQDIANNAGLSDPTNFALLGAGRYMKLIGESGALQGVKAAASNVVSKASDAIAASPAASTIVQAAKQGAQSLANVAGTTVEGAGNVLQKTGQVLKKPAAIGTLTGAGTYLETRDPTKALEAGVGAGVGSAVLGKLGIGGSHGKFGWIGAPIETTGDLLENAGQAIKGDAPFALPDALKPFAKAAGSVTSKINDLAQTDTGRGAIAGMVFSVPLLPASDNTDDAVTTLLNGGAFGALGGLSEGNPNAAYRRAGARVFADMAPENYGNPVNFNGTPVDLDALHSEAIQGLSENQKLAVQAQRGFLPNAEIYVLDDAQMQGLGLPKVSGIYDHPQITTDAEVNGQPKKVIIINKDLAALGHESGHYIFDQLDDDQRSQIVKSVADNVSDDSLQNAYLKYTRQLANGYLSDEDKIPESGVTLGEDGTIKANLGQESTPQRLAQAKAIQKSSDYWNPATGGDPMALIKEYIAEQFGSIAQGDESLAGHSMAGKSLAQILTDAFNAAKQKLIGQTSKTALGFENSPAVQDNLRQVLKQVAADRLAQPATPTPAPDPYASVAKPVQTPVATPSASPEPNLNHPATSSDAYNDAKLAAQKLKITKKAIDAGIQSAQNDQINDSEAILRRIITSQQGVQTPQAPLAEVPAPIPEAPLEKVLAPPITAKPKPDINNIRVEPGIGPKASIDPFARTGTPSKVPTLQSTEGVPVLGLRKGSKRVLDTKTGEVTNVEQNHLVGRAINPKNPDEVALVKRAAEDSGEPKKFADNLRSVEDSIANGTEINTKYESANSDIMGSPSNKERGIAQEEAKYGLTTKSGVQKTMTPTGIEFRTIEEPIFTRGSLENAKKKLDDFYTKATKKDGSIKSGSRANLFPTKEEAHYALESIAKSRAADEPIKGYSLAQSKFVHDMFDTAPKDRAYATGYSQDKVIANAKNLSDALADSHTLQDPELRRLHDYLKGTEWAKDLVDRNENMAKGFRGDGGIFTDANGRDISGPIHTDEGEIHGSRDVNAVPVHIEDWKIQALNTIEGGPSRTFYKEAQVNAASAGRQITDKPMEESTNPLYQKLDSLGEKLFLSRGDSPIKGVGDIVAPASETLRLDRIKEISGTSPIELPPSSYAQRAAAFMPKKDDDREYVRPEEINERIQNYLANEENERHNATHGTPLNPPTVDVGKKAGGRNPKVRGNGKAAEDDATRMGGGSERGNSGRQKNDFSAMFPASTPEQFTETYLSHVAEKSAQGEYPNGPDGLFGAAAKSGQFISAKQLATLKPFEIKGGVEHQAFIIPDGKDSKSIVKVTRPGKYGLNDQDEIGYLRRMQEMDQLTGGNLNIKILGVTPKGTWPSIVTKMNYIQGVEPSEEDLNAYLVSKGWEDMGFYAYRHPATGIEIYDAHTGNFIQVESGKMVPIDIMVEGGPATKPIPIPQNGLFMPKLYGAWIDRSGYIIPVQSQSLHANVAQKELANLDEISNEESTAKYGSKSVDKLLEKGYIHVSSDSNTIFVGSNEPISISQKKSLIDLGETSGREVSLQVGQGMPRTIYDPKSK